MLQLHTNNQTEDNSISLIRLVEENGHPSIIIIIIFFIYFFYM